MYEVVSYPFIIKLEGLSAVVTSVLEIIDQKVTDPS
jgi:hypothetical protein